MCHQQSAPLPFRLGGEVMRCPQALLVALLTHAHTAFAAPLWQRPAGEPPWAAGRATQLAAGDDGAAHRFVVTTRSDASLDAVHAACNHTGAASTGHACAGLLSGLCRRVFTSAVTGFAGSFTPRQLRQMHACAPDVLKLVEHDAPVTVMAAPTVALPTLGAPTATLWSLDRIDQALPGWVCRVIYEDLVEDTEVQIRRLLDYCGLPFEEACLRFYDTDRAVRTVSSEQVRRPIFRDGLEQWRRFEPFLDPLKDALGDVTDRWRGAAPAAALS